MREVHRTQVASQRREISAIDAEGDDAAARVKTNTELISKLYDVAGAPEEWSRFLGIILESLSGSVAAVVTHSFGQQPDRLWAFHSINVRLPSPADGRDRVLNGSNPNLEHYAIVPPSLIHRLSGLNYMMSCVEVAIDQPCLIYDYGVEHAAIGLCDRDSDTLSFIVVGLPPEQNWKSKNRLMLETLLPHLAKIIRLSSLIEGISVRAVTANFVLDRLPIGIITFYSASSFPTLNIVADQLIKTAPGLLPHLKRLALAQFKACRRSALAQFVKLPEPLSEMLHFAIMSEIPTQQTGMAAVTFFIVGSDRHIPIDTSALQSLFRLTNAEARIAALIVKGNHIDDIAESLSLSLYTVRTHLRHIFEKTNVGRQADLINLLLRTSIAINTSIR